MLDVLLQVPRLPDEQRLFPKKLLGNQHKKGRELFPFRIVCQECTQIPLVLTE